MSGRRTLTVLLLALIWAPALLVAQRPERRPPPRDSVAVASLDSTASDVLPISFFRPETGVRLSDRDLVLSRQVVAGEVLAEIPGSFYYNHVMPGWPEAWTPHGTPPHLVSARHNGLPFNNLFTGAAQFDLLPVEALAPLSLSFFNAAATTISATTRRFLGRPPLTEIRYNTGSESRQFVSVVHSQDRSQKLFGKAGRLGVLFRYGGRSSGGPYTGGNARTRQVDLRLIFQRPSWIAELTYMLARVQRGAYAGVLPESRLSSIYDQFSPTVRLSSAEKDRDRDDLTLRTAFRWSNGVLPLEMAGFLSSQRDEYRYDGDTLGVRGRDLGVVVRQPFQIGKKHLVAAEIRAGATRFRPTKALTDTLGSTVPHLQLMLSDSATVFGAGIMASAVLRSVDQARRFGGNLLVDRALGAVRLTASGKVAHYFPSLHDRQGFGDVLVAAANLKPSEIRSVDLAARTDIGVITLGLKATVSEIRKPIDYWSQVDVFADEQPVVVVRQDSLSRRWLTGTIDFGWRKAATRGFYVFGDATYRHFASDGSIRPGKALPEIDGKLQIGIRYVLFQGDLDLDAAIRARAWTSFESRTLHAPTGHFALQELSPLEIGQSGTLDVFIEGGIRTATLFLSVENLLSGLVYDGVMLVPVYPLPARAFRFGAYWPLRN